MPIVVVAEVLSLLSLFVFEGANHCRLVVRREKANRDFMVFYFSEEEMITEILASRLDRCRCDHQISQLPFVLSTSVDRRVILGNKVLFLDFLSRKTNAIIRREIIVHSVED